MKPNFSQKPTNPARLTTRGHTFKLYKPQCRTNIRKFSFSLRVIENWNKLPTNIENCHSVNSFKNFINKVWKNHPVKFFSFLLWTGSGQYKQKQSKRITRGRSLNDISRTRNKERNN